MGKLTHWTREQKTQAAIAEQCKELSRTMRDHRVISVQEDSHE